MKYIAETYQELIQKGYSYNSVIQKEDNGWKVASVLYQRNYINAPDNIQRIPKRIHQIWLGSPVPEKYKRFMESWQRFNPTWEYKLWTDDNIDIKLLRPRMFNEVSNQGMRSDILRYDILQQLGGVYVDTDFECLKPFDDFLNLDFFTGISYDGTFCLYNGLIGCTPKHPIISACRNDLNLPVNHFNRIKSSAIMSLTGPYYFTRKFLEYTNKNIRLVVAFPMDFFYPLPNNIKHCKNPYDYVQPASYAIHHWEVSWLQNIAKGE